MDNDSVPRTVYIALKIVNAIHTLQNILQILNIEAKGKVIEFSIEKKSVGYNLRVLCKIHLNIILIHLTAHEIIFEFDLCYSKTFSVKTCAKKLCI